MAVSKGPYEIEMIDSQSGCEVGGGRRNASTIASLPYTLGNMTHKEEIKMPAMIRKTCHNRFGHGCPLLRL